MNQEALQKFWNNTKRINPDFTMEFDAFASAMDDPEKRKRFYANTRKLNPQFTMTDDEADERLGYNETAESVPDYTSMTQEQVDALPMTTKEEAYNKNFAQWALTDTGKEAIQRNRDIASREQERLLEEWKKTNGYKMASDKARYEQDEDARQKIMQDAFNEQYGLAFKKYMQQHNESLHDAMMKDRADYYNTDLLNLYNQGVDVGFDFTTWSKTNDPELNKKYEGMRDKVDEYKGSQLVADVVNQFNSDPARVNLLGRSITEDEVSTVLNGGRINLDGSLGSAVGRSVREIADASIDSNFPEWKQTQVDFSRGYSDATLKPMKDRQAKVEQMLQETAYMDENGMIRYSDDALKVAADNYRKIDKLRDASYKGDPAWKAFFKGVGASASDPNTWLWNIPEVANNSILQKTIKKAMSTDENVELTDSEMEMLDSMLALTNMQSIRQDNISNAYRGGQIAMEQIPFAIEMALSGGIGELAGKGAITAFARRKSKHIAEDLALKEMRAESVRLGRQLTGEEIKGLEKKAQKAATEQFTKMMSNESKDFLMSLGRFGASPVESLVLPSTWTGVTLDMATKVTGKDTDENGKTVYTFEDGDNFAKALAQNANEVVSEREGDVLQGALGLIKNAVVRSKLGARLGKTRLGDFSRYAMTFVAPSLNVMKRAGVSGVPFELAEEALGVSQLMLLGKAFGGVEDWDKQFDEFWTKDNIESMLIGFATMPLGGSVASVLGYGRANMNADRAKAALEKSLLDSGLTEEAAASFIEGIGSVETEQLNKYMSDMAINNGISTEGRARIFNNTINYLANKTSVDTYLNDSFDINEYADEVKSRMNEADIMTDYVNNEMNRMQGYTNSNSGNMVMVELTNGENVFVTDGLVTPNGIGGISYEQTSENLVVSDADGHSRVINRGEVRNFLQEVPFDAEAYRPQIMEKFESMGGFDGVVKSYSDIMADKRAGLIAAAKEQYNSQQEDLVRQHQEQEAAIQQAEAEARAQREAEAQAAQEQAQTEVAQPTEQEQAQAAQAQAEQQKNEFMDSLPKKDNGVIDYNKMSREQMFRFLSYKNGIDAAYKIFQEEISTVRKQIPEIEANTKLSPIEKGMAIAAVEDQISQLNDIVNRLVPEDVRKAMAQQAPANTQEQATAETPAATTTPSATTTPVENSRNKKNTVETAAPAAQPAPASAPAATTTEKEEPKPILSQGIVDTLNKHGMNTDEVRAAAEQVATKKMSVKSFVNQYLAGKMSLDAAAEITTSLSERCGKWYLIKNTDFNKDAPKAIDVFGDDTIGVFHVGDKWFIARKVEGDKLEVITSQLPKYKAGDVIEMGNAINESKKFVAYRGTEKNGKINYEKVIICNVGIVNGGEIPRGGVKVYTVNTFGEFGSSYSKDLYVTNKSGKFVHLLTTPEERKAEIAAKLEKEASKVKTVVDMMAWEPFGGMVLYKKRGIDKSNKKELLLINTTEQLKDIVGDEVTVDSVKERLNTAIDIWNNLVERNGYDELMPEGQTLKVSGRIDAYQSAKTGERVKMQSIEQAIKCDAAKQLRNALETVQSWQLTDAEKYKRLKELEKEAKNKKSSENSLTNEKNSVTLQREKEAAEAKSRRGAIIQTMLGSVPDDALLPTELKKRNATLQKMMQKAGFEQQVFYTYKDLYQFLLDKGGDYFTQAAKGLQQKVMTCKTKGQSMYGINIKTLGSFGLVDFIDTYSRAKRVVAHEYQHQIFREKNSSLPIHASEDFMREIIEHVNGSDFYNKRLSQADIDAMGDNPLGRKAGEYKYQGQALRNEFLSHMMEVCLCAPQDKLAEVLGSLGLDEVTINSIITAYNNVKESNSIRRLLDSSSMERRTGNSRKNVSVDRGTSGTNREGDANPSEALRGESGEVDSTEQLERGDAEGSGQEDEGRGLNTSFADFAKQGPANYQEDGGYAGRDDEDDIMDSVGGESYLSDEARVQILNDLQLKDSLDDEFDFSVGKSLRSTFAAWCRNNRPELSTDDVATAIEWLDTFDKSNVQYAAGYWFARGMVRIGEDDQKIVDAVEVARRKNVAPTSFASPGELLATYDDVNLDANKRINPDDVPTLHKRDTYAEGVTVYDVDNDFESMINMREVINTHWGKKANPWCLLHGADDGSGDLADGQNSQYNAVRYWNQYSGYPKRVAFQNGKLLAFCANDSATVAWWDRKDHRFNGIPIIKKHKNGRMAQYQMDEDEQSDVLFTGIEWTGDEGNGDYTEWRDGVKRFTLHRDNGLLTGLQTRFDAAGNPIIEMKMSVIDAPTDQIDPETGEVLESAGGKREKIDSIKFPFMEMFLDVDELIDGENCDIHITRADDLSIIGAQIELLGVDDGTAKYDENGVLISMPKTQVKTIFLDFGLGDSFPRKIVIANNKNNWEGNIEITSTGAMSVRYDIAEYEDNTYSYMNFYANGNMKRAGAFDENGEVHREMYNEDGSMSESFERTRNGHVSRQYYPNGDLRFELIYDGDTTLQKNFNVDGSESINKRIYDDNGYSVDLNRIISEDGSITETVKPTDMMEFTFLKSKDGELQKSFKEEYLDYEISDLTPEDIEWAIERNPLLEGHLNEGGIMFSIGGEKGAKLLDSVEGVNTRMDNLELAKQMENEGFNPYQIRVATGWEKGFDDMWRYEIMDGEFINLDNIRAGETVLLPYIFKNDELFKAYPELKDVQFRFSYSLQNGEYGSYDHSKRLLEISSDFLRTDKIDNVSMLAAISHEIQHAIQNIEGFETGANYSKAYSIASHQDGYDELSKLESQVYLLNKRAISVVERAIRNGEIEPTKEEELLLAIGKYDAMESTTANKLAETNDDLASIMEKLAPMYARKKELNETMANPYIAYRRVSGEVEARNVEERLAMTAEERLHSLLSETEDVSRADQYLMTKSLELLNDRSKYANSGISADSPFSSMMEADETLNKLYEEDVLQQEIAKKDAENLRNSEKSRTFAVNITQNAGEDGSKNRLGFLNEQDRQTVKDGLLKLREGNISDEEREQISATIDAVSNKRTEQMEKIVAAAVSGIEGVTVASAKPALGVYINNAGKEVIEYSTVVELNVQEGYEEASVAAMAIVAEVTKQDSFIVNYPDGKSGYASHKSEFIPETPLTNTQKAVLSERLSAMGIGATITSDSVVALNYTDMSDDTFDKVTSYLYRTINYGDAETTLSNAQRIKTQAEFGLEEALRGNGEAGMHMHTLPGSITFSPHYSDFNERRTKNDVNTDANGRPLKNQSDRIYQKGRSGRTESGWTNVGFYEDNDLPIRGTSVTPNDVRTSAQEAYNSTENEMFDEPMFSVGGIQGVESDVDMGSILDIPVGIDELNDKDRLTASRVGKENTPLIQYQVTKAAEFVHKTMDRTEFLRRMQNEINAYRKSLGLPPMTWRYNVRGKLESANATKQAKLRLFDKHATKLTKCVKDITKSIKSSGLRSVLPASDLIQESDGSMYVPTDMDLLERYLIAMDNMERLKLGIPMRGEEEFYARTGMTFREYADLFHEKVDKKAIVNIWKTINVMGKISRDAAHEAGLISDVAYDGYEERKFYLPEKGFLEEDIAGRDIDDISAAIRGNRYRRGIKPTGYSNAANGGESLAHDVLAYLIYDTRDTLMKAEDNKVKIAMEGLLNANPEWTRENLSVPTRVWYVREVDGEENVEYVRTTEEPSLDIRQEQQNMLKEIARLKKECKATKDRDRKRELGTLIDDMEKRLPLGGTKLIQGNEAARKVDDKTSIVTYYKNGELYEMNFGPRVEVACALNGVLSPNAKKAISGFVPKLCQYIAATYTAYNYEFAPVNLVKDQMFTCKRGNAIYGIEFEGRWAINMTRNLGSMVKQIARWAYSGELGEATEDDRLFTQFILGGGQTGRSQLDSVKDIRNKILGQKTIEGVVIDDVLGFGGLAMVFTEMSELLTRYCAFKTVYDLRMKSYDYKNGKVSEEDIIREAIDQSRNLGVNFDRKGFGGTFLDHFNSLSVFVTPAIQGPSGMFRAFDKNGGKAFTNLMLVPAMFGAFFTLLTSAMIDDDDEFNPSDEDIRTKLVLGKNIRFKVAEELTPFWALGAYSVLVAQGKRKFSDALYYTLETAFENLIPMANNIKAIPNAILGIAFDKDTSLADALVGCLTPEALEGLINLSDNKDSFGGSLKKQNYGTIPQYELSPNSSDMEKFIAKIGYIISGGDTDSPSIYKIGKDNKVLLDWNPRQVSSILSMVIPSGDLRLVRTVVDLAETIASGENKVRLTDIPIANRFAVDDEYNKRQYRFDIVSPATKELSEVQNHLEANAYRVHNIKEELKNVTDPEKEAELDAKLQAYKEEQNAIIERFGGKQLLTQLGKALGDYKMNNLYFLAKSEKVGLDRYRQRYSKEELEAMDKAEGEAVAEVLAVMREIDEVRKSKQNNEDLESE